MPAFSLAEPGPFACEQVTWDTPLERGGFTGLAFGLDATFQGLSRAVEQEVKRRRKDGPTQPQP